MSLVNATAWNLATRLMDAMQVPECDRKNVTSLTLSMGMDRAATLTIERIANEADGERILKVAHLLRVAEGKEL